MIEVNEQIEVSAAPQAVWQIMSDPAAVVECVAGASLGERQEDGSFDAIMVVKFGPAKVTMKSRVVLELDAAAMTGKVTARGKDAIGGTRVVSNTTFSVRERADPPGSVVPIHSEVEISGKLASLIETGANLVVKRMVTEFTEKLAERLAGGT